MKLSTLLKLAPALLVAAFATSMYATHVLAQGALTNPGALKEQAPAVYKAKFDTSKGVFVIEVHRDWAPNGADRFYNLVKNGFYDDAQFFRVIPGFMVQFGIHGTPAIQRNWKTAQIPDDRVTQTNARGMVSFATAGPGTRTTQVFVNYGNNARLDASGFSPFGKVISGMDVVDKFYSGYGEGAPSGGGPDQSKIQTEGNKYLSNYFPSLDVIRKATIEK